MSVQQHPVPQHISSYEFRLVGDMTLKQFGYLAGGVVISLFFYALPLSPFFKWILISVSIFFGLAFAFMPIEERPLSTWMVAFIKATLNPTLFIWKKRPEKPEIFAPIIHSLSTKISLNSTLPDKTKLQEYLQTLPLSPLDKDEEKFLIQVNELFRTTKVSAKPETTLSPKPQVSSESYAPPPKPFIPPWPPLEIKVKPGEKVSEKPLKPTKPIVFPEKPSKTSRPTVAPKINPFIPLPLPPTRPNVLVGMVLSKDDLIIEGAIIEIRNSQGVPVRALKTNKLGQFEIATPLENDTYEIEIEKEGYKFDIIKIKVEGKIIPPIEIKAK